MHSDQPFLTSGVNLVKRIRPQVGVHVLAYTPEEISECLNRPFFREEILHKGMTMPLHPPADAQRWLAFAREDLQMAKLALTEGLFNQTCFHAQPCVEKSLKVLLVWQGELLLRTHALADIWTRLPESARAHLESLYDRFLELDQVYIPTRYPVPYLERFRREYPSDPMPRRHFRQLDSVGSKSRHFVVNLKFRLSPPLAYREGLRRPCIEWG